MDSFTENILERARQRQKKLIENDSSTLMAEMELNSDNNITGEHLRALPNNCKQNKKLSDADVDNFKKHTEKKKGNHIFVNNFEVLEESEGYAKAESLSSNKVNSVNGELVKKELSNSDQNNKLKRNRKGLGGLANLVKDMNEWEDDLSKSNRTNAEQKLASQKKWKPPASGSPVLSVRLPDNCPNTSRPPKIKYQAPKPPVLNSPTKCNSSSMEGTPKQLSLDPAVVEILDNENIKTAEIKVSKKVICCDQNHIIQEESELESTVVNEQPLKPLVPSQKNNIKGSAVAHKAAMFEAACSPNKNNKDPALLSLPERKALFEKNKSKPLIPKAPISLAPSSPKCAHNEKTATVLSNKNEVRFPSARPPIRKNDVGEQSFKIPEGQSGIASKMAALFENKSTISQLQIEKDIREQRQKEMDILLNRFPCTKNAHNLQPDANCEAVIENTCAIGENESVEKIGNKRKSNDKISKKGDSPNVVASLEDIKRIKVASAKPGKLYPCLSDIEAMTETETENNTASTSPNNSSLGDSYLGSESEEADTSFGHGVLKTICKDQVSKKRLIYDESTESDLSDILDDSNEYLDEAINYKASDENGPTPPKQNRSISPVNNILQASHSFQFKNFSPRKELIPYNVSENDGEIVQEIESLETANQLPTYVVDGDTILPLTHTVSFYRKQQTEVLKTPIRKIIRNPIIEEPLNSVKIPIDEETEVREKIQQLLEYITKQEAIISQTSQALNLCYSAPEFTGSTEHVEAEKVLLLATHRRSAAQMEIERLSVLRTLHQETSETLNVPLEKGSLTISNIVLPLKRDYVRALNATGGKGHHVVCLVKCAEQVQMSRLVSTVATNSRNENLELSIPGSIHLKDIYSNFTIQFEVYCLQAQEEVIPHEVKYHINKKVNNKLTPKKYKPESCLIKPPKESSGGPQIVRSPIFALMGYVVFSIQAMNRKSWTLNNAPSMSPLEGVVEMRVSCELSLSVEHRGFLTMFEDVSGFGAWHRRWCLLKDNILCYWKYPEEEKKKASIGSIDLSACIAHQIGPVRRDICARLNTILIETKRPAEPHDKNSLVMECKGEFTIIRHLLSADTKEEKNEWCSMFNKALMTMKINKNIK